MPLIFKKSNKSQASLEKITDTRDSSPGRRDQRIHGQQQLEPDNAYPQSVPSYPHSPYHAYQHSQQQQYQSHSQNQQQQQQQLDERYYAEQQQQQQQQQQQPHPPPHVLNRSSSNRQGPGHPPNAYQEQQQLQPQRPTISVIAPNNLLHESIAEDELHEPGRTQFGTSQTVRTPGSKDEKKSRRSAIGDFFRSDKKDGRDIPVDQSRLSRTGSVLKRPSISQPIPNSPQTSQPQQPSPQSPQAIHSESITAYLQQSQEDLRDDPKQYERYYQGGDNRPESRFDIYAAADKQQPQRRPSIQYEEDAPHFPAPAIVTQQQHETQQQIRQQQLPPQQPLQIYQQPNISQTLDEPTPEQSKQFFPYTGQPLRDRPSTQPEIDQSLRPPSQNSLIGPGPPSPLGNPPPVTSHPSTSNNPRYSVQSVQAYQQAQQAANQIQAQNQSQGQTGQEARNPQLLQAQEDMPSSGRDRERQQRDIRPEEQDPRYAAQQDPRVRMSTTGHEGRNTPPPRGRDDVSQLDHQTLILRYEELQAKYSKVKRYYFDREAQVTQLQNTVANQRLSMSKTSLDDAQYATRFDRLNGAIQNLAFNIRKDWRRLPNWLAPACNRDACSTGTKEMTAVGRAIFTRWLFDHIFQEVFHPGIDPTLSQSLKQMERILRRTPSTMLTEEQRDDLLTKVITWRLTTCEGLSDVLNSRQQEAYTESLARVLADQLYDYLRPLVSDPPPANLDGYLLPIVAQALSITANLPLESRDICIDYYHPGMMYNEMFMKMESGMTALANPGSAPTRDDYDDENGDNDEPMSVTSDADQSAVEEQIREAAKAAQNQTPATSGSKSGEKAKKSGGLFGGGFAGGFVSKKPPLGSSSLRGTSAQDLTQSVHSQATKTSQDGGGEDDHQWTFDAMVRGQKEGKIRFAVFVSVEVRGKSPGSSSSKNEGTNNASSSTSSAQQQQQQNSSNGNNVSGSSADAGGKSNQGTTSAGLGVSSSSGGTSGGAGMGGVNVLMKAPVFGF